MAIYSKIYDFCKVKNKGMCFENGDSPTPRVQFIMDLCDSEGLKYELDVWSKEGRKRELNIEDFNKISHLITKDKREQAEEIYSKFMDDFSKLSNKEVEPEDADPGQDMEELSDEEYGRYIKEYQDLVDQYTEELKELVGELEEPINNFYNVMLMGSSDKFVVAHHDIVNPKSDNANDNSCSVINALAIKKLRPEVNVVILDGEEPGGIGSTRLAERIKAGEFPCKWVLNLELTGKGGKNFFVGSMGTPLTQWIADRFECPVVNVPFNDSVIFRKYDINSTVINPLPVTEEKTPILTKDGEYLNFKMLFNCHRMEDSVSTIDPSDMEEFVNEVCLKIIDEA